MYAASRPTAMMEVNFWLVTVSEWDAPALFYSPITPASNMSAGKLLQTPHIPPMSMKKWLPPIQTYDPSHTNVSLTNLELSKTL